jgi:putative ABC transport system substrate-binding protein
MSICLRRREFIVALGAAATWPLAVKAQQPPAIPVIGVLGSGSRSSFEFALDAFTQGLRQQAI